MHLHTLPNKEKSNPKFLILFSGTPGMGKTTIAKKLEEHFQAIRLSTDEARLLLKANNLSPALADSYIEWCLHAIYKELPNQLIILDRSVDRTYPTYLQFAKDFGYNTFLVRMDVQRSIVEGRIRQRGRDVHELLQAADRSWNDFEQFGKKYSSNFHFVNNASLDEPLSQLISILSEKIDSTWPLKRLKKGSNEYQEIREQIEKGDDSLSIQADMHEILPGLYFGNQKAADTLPLGFSHVLSCRSIPQNTHASKIIWKGISFADSPESNMLPVFDETYDFIEHTTDAILVHCREGVSRSTTIVIAYLMKKFGVSYQKAYEFVKKKRSIAEPNSGFKEQLKQYETLLY